MHKYLQAILWRFTCCTMRARIAYVILKVISNGKWFPLELQNFLDVISVLHRECITYHYVLLISLIGNLLNMKYIAICNLMIKLYDQVVLKTTITITHTDTRQKDICCLLPINIRMFWRRAIPRMVSHAKSQLYNIENCSADIYYYGVVVNANVVTYICMMHNCCFISVHNIVMSLVRREGRNCQQKYWWCNT